MGSWSHSLELHMPAAHRSIVQTGAAEDGHPAILVYRAGPPELLWVRQEADDNSLLFTQPSDLSVELIKPCFENLGGATSRAAPHGDALPVKRRDCALWPFAPRAVVPLSFLCRRRPQLPCNRII